MIFVINRWLNQLFSAALFWLGFFWLLFLFFWSLSSLTPNGNSIFHVLPQRTYMLVIWQCNRYCSAIAIPCTYGNMPFNEHLEDDNGPCTYEVKHGRVYISLTWIDWLYIIYFIILTTLWLLILLCWECFLTFHINELLQCPFIK